MGVSRGYYSGHSHITDEIKAFIQKKDGSADFVLLKQEGLWGY